MVGNSLWFLVMQSDMMTKSVLALLLFLSIACWTIFLYKLMISYRQHMMLKNALRSLSMHHSVHDLITYAEKNPASSIAYIIKKQEFLYNTVAQKSAKSDEYMHALANNYAEQLIDSLVQQEQSLFSVLSTTAVVAPLLGLFGTVWGLVHAFLNIAQQQTADIATVAPGIAEALITTLVGLMVAIPAQVMYNILVVRARHFDRLLMQCADMVTVIFQHRF